MSVWVGVVGFPGVQQGIAAEVPYVALPPGGEVPAATDAPLVLAWPAVEAPACEATLAQALPLQDLPAWRVYLGRLEPVSLPTLVGTLRAKLGLDTAVPLGVLGLAGGATVALQAAEDDLDITALALVSPVIRDGLACAACSSRAAVLVVTGTADSPDSPGGEGGDGGDGEHADVDPALLLWGTLSSSGRAPERTSLVTLPDLHDPDRLDALLTDWFQRYLIPGGPECP